MHRGIAALVAVAMLSTSSSAAMWHVHAYVDHDHAEHHHGPASHGHLSDAHAHALDSHGPDQGAQLESCEPREHVVSVAFTYVAPQPDHAPAPATLDTIVGAPRPQPWRQVTPSDVRAHSPPRLTDAPLRAPPLVHLA